MEKIKITIKLWKNNGTVKTYHSTKTRRIYTILKADNFLKAYLKVSYGIDKESINEADCQTKKDLLSMLKAFTEK